MSAAAAAPTATAATVTSSTKQLGRTNRLQQLLWSLLLQQML
jgi:hypothetical protein